MTQVNSPNQVRYTDTARGHTLIESGVRGKAARAPLSELDELQAASRLVCATKRQGSRDRSYLPGRRGHWTSQEFLEANGYETVRGYWDLWTAEDCKLPIQTIGNCYGNNPTAPYVLAMLSHWKDEFVNQSMHPALPAGQRNMTPNYRLGEREALVIVAEIPPPARYFGMQTNVLTRDESFYEDDPAYQLLEAAPDLQAIIFGVSPNPDRRMLVASIGNSVNDVVICATRSPSNLTGRSGRQ